MELPTDRARPRMHRRRTQLLLIVVICAGVFFALLTLGGALDAGANKQTSGSLGSNIATAIVGAALLTSSVLWAIHIERRLRSHRLAATTSLGVTHVAPTYTELSPRLHTSFRWIAVALPLVMAIVFGIGGIQGIRSVHESQFLLAPVAGGVTTTGRVTSFQTSCFRSCTYKPTITFVDAAGKTHKFVAPFQGDEPMIGQKVDVSFDPRNASIAHDTSEGPASWDFELYTMYLVTSMAVFAGFMFLFAIRTFVRSKHRIATA